MSGDSDDELEGLLALGSRWLLAGIIGWTLVLSIDALVSGMGLHSDSLLFHVRLATEQSVWLSAPLLLLHGLRLHRRSRAVKRVELELGALVLLLALVPSWEQAHTLSSGDAISEHAQIAWIRIGLFAALVASWLLLWLWHLSLASAVRVLRLPGFASRRRLLPLLGAAAALLLFWGIRSYASTYESFAAHLSAHLWLLLSTLVFLVLPAARALPLALPLAAATIVTLLSWASIPDATRARSVTHLGQTFARLGDKMLFGPGPSPLRLRLFDSAAPEACAALDAHVPLPPLEVSTTRRDRVLIISVDALRQDALSWSRDGQALMPSLSAASEGALVFERAVTAYPATLLSLASSFTGQWPHRLLLDSQGSPPSVLSTGATQSTSARAFLPRVHWFKQPIVDELLLQGALATQHENAATQIDALISELEEARRAGKGYRHWLHLFEPHQPYQGHKGFAFGRSPRQLYQSEVAYIDRELGRLLRYLDTSASFDDTLVVFFSDHGEALGERGYFGHDVYLDAWISDVPLFLWVPGVQGARLDAPVSTASIASTLRHYQGESSRASRDAPSLFEEGLPDEVVIHAFSVRGKGLSKLFDIPDRARRLQRIQSERGSFRSKVAIHTRDHRLILHRDSSIQALYDRTGSPQSLRNLLFDESALASQLSERLRRWHESESLALSCPSGSGPAGSSPR